MTSKPEKRQDLVEVTYTKERWELLHDFRETAIKLLEVLQARNIDAVVHGSLARGDVHKESDIDIFIPNPPSSFQIETTLEQAKIPITTRTVIQATPSYAMKAYIEIGATAQVSFPLMGLRNVERDFYKFSGEANVKQLREDIRVVGVDKRLMLIEPTRAGHIESGIIGREDHVAKILGVEVQPVLDRVHALTRRDMVGRTGVFLKNELKPDETFEMALNRLAAENPAVRRRLKNL